MYVRSEPSTSGADPATGSDGTSSSSESRLPPRRHGHRLSIRSHSFGIGVLFWVREWLSEES